MSLSDFYLFLTMKQNLGGHKFKDDGEMGKSCDTAIINRRKQKSSFYLRASASVAVWTMWE
jgi:hypothetical protein